MSKELEACELEVGMLVTVLKRQGTENRTGMGATLTITAIDRPYIVTVEDNGYDGTYVHTVDLRKVTLGTISRAYCAALNGAHCQAAPCRPCKASARWCRTRKSQCCPCYRD